MFTRNNARLLAALYGRQPVRQVSPLGYLSPAPGKPDQMVRI